MWISALFWLIAVLVIVQWRARWRFAGGITPRRFFREFRRSLGNMQGLLMIAGIFSIVVLPFSVAFDFIPPALIPIQIPLAIIAVLGTTEPVSFLVLGPSSGYTAEICEMLVSSFPLLRVGAALDPRKLGVFDDHALGPSGNLWVLDSESWRCQVIRMMEDAPLIVFDGRSVTPHTRWEFSYLLQSPQLPRVVVVGPVGDRDIAEFLCRFDGVPVIEKHILTEVLKAAAGSRERLRGWCELRRQAILAALSRFSLPPELLDRFQTSQMHFFAIQFSRAIPDLIRLHGGLDGEL